MKNKTKLNIIVDAAMFAVMLAVGGIGFLLKYRLLRGSLRRAIFEHEVDQFFWGWERHQWGSLHLILGFVLFGLLLLHLVLHWNQIKTMVRKLIPSRAPRVILSTLFLVACAVMLFFAFMVRIDTVQIKAGEGRQRDIHTRSEHEKGAAATEPAGAGADTHEAHEAHRELPDNAVTVNGSMTLSEIERVAGVPADSLKKILGIPESISNNERLGRLRRQYGFHMSEIERYIEVYHEKR